jgi:hypothetical protein
LRFNLTSRNLSSFNSIASLQVSTSAAADKEHTQTLIYCWTYLQLTFLIFDMDISYARMVRTASLTSYTVRCKILHQRTHSHKWRHAAAAMRAHNVLCNSYNRITVEINRCSFRSVRFALLYIVTRSKIV